MHAANLSKSARLQRTLTYLRGAGARGLSTSAISRRTGSMAVHSDIAELRANGVGVTCRYDHTTPAGRRVYRYRLA